MSPSTSAQVLGLSSSCQGWITLETIFCQQCQAKLQSLTKGSLSIEADLAKLKSVLVAINHPISESEIFTCTLNGLPNTMEYQPVVFTIENRENPLTFDDLRQCLLVHEQILKHMHGSSSPILDPTGSHPQESAMVASSSGGPQDFNQCMMADVTSVMTTVTLNTLLLTLMAINMDHSSHAGALGQHGIHNKWNFSLSRIPEHGIPRCQICQKSNHTAVICEY